MLKYKSIIHNNASSNEKNSSVVVSLVKMQSHMCLELFWTVNGAWSADFSPDSDQKSYYGLLLFWTSVYFNLFSLNFYIYIFCFLSLIFVIFLCDCVIFLLLFFIFSFFYIIKIILIKRISILVLVILILKLFPLVTKAAFLIFFVYIFFY